MDKINNISLLVEKYTLGNESKRVPKKAAVKPITKSKKAILLEKYKGCNELLAEKAAKNKERINALKQSFSNQPYQYSRSFYKDAKRQSLLQLRWIYYYQIKLLESQSKAKK